MLEDVSHEFQAIRFYRIDVDRHIMLSRAYSDKILPEVAFVKNGADFLILRGDISHQEIQKGFQTILDSTA